jgi:hypothetical protein
MTAALEATPTDVIGDDSYASRDMSAIGGGVSAIGVDTRAASATGYGVSAEGGVIRAGDVADCGVCDVGVL